jgi:D-3-phosphoglycerate dehydrogenase
MTTKKVLITDYVHPEMLPGLLSLGFHTTYAPMMSRAEMEAALPDFHGVVINTRCSIDAKTIASAGKLEWIGRLGSGLDIIDLPAAAAHNVQVFSAPEGNAQAVAEHALGMLLALSNKIPSADRSVREGQWLREAHRGWELDGKTIGIIGYGNNGSAFGRIWKGWNVRVLAYDKYLSGFGNEWITETSQDEVLSQSDVISLHIPLTAETRDLVNEAFLARCKKGVVLINTSRGKNVDLVALVAGLQSGQVAGACLDVFAAEPPSKGPADFLNTFNILGTMDNVILSPHVAGWTVESFRKITMVLLDKISRYLSEKLI